MFEASVFKFGGLLQRKITEIFISVEYLLHYVYKAKINIRPIIEMM